MYDNLAIILNDALNIANGRRITTFLLPRFPKILVQEPGTHRQISSAGLPEPLVTELNVFDRSISRNSASSRAIPVEKVIDLVRKDPYIPSWTRNQKGMVGSHDLDRLDQEKATHLWLTLMDQSCQTAQALSELGAAKQDTNRVLDPYMRIPILMTATEWDHFWDLRCSPDVQPDFREIALAMRELYTTHSPKEVDSGEWHINFLDKYDPEAYGLVERLKVASARAARMSYATHDGVIDVERDITLANSLLDNRHMSPFEHSAVATEKDEWYYNLRGWKSFRWILDKEPRFFGKTILF